MRRLLMVAVVIVVALAARALAVSFAAEAPERAVSTRTPNGWVLEVHGDGSGRLLYGSSGPDCWRFGAGTFDAAEVIHDLEGLPCDEKGKIGSHFTFFLESGRQGTDKPWHANYTRDTTIIPGLFQKAIVAADSGDVFQKRHLLRSCPPSLPNVSLDDVDHLAAARAAEEAFHKACDAWADAAARGGDKRAAAREINRYNHQFITHILKTNYRACAAVLIPDQIASAGVIEESDGTKFSYLVGKGQSGLYISTWSRSEWPADRLPLHGFAARITMSAQAFAGFSVGIGTWADDEEGVLRVPYKLYGDAGVIEIRRGEQGWEIIPDRGIVSPSGNWAPYARRPTLWQKLAQSCAQWWTGRANRRYSWTTLVSFLSFCLAISVAFLFVLIRRRLVRVC